jgi:hypothetical protein
MLEMKFFKDFKKKQKKKKKKRKNQKGVGQAVEAFKWMKRLNLPVETFIC